MCVCVLAAGDVSIWDFSGVKSYYVTYDKFLGDPNAIYLLVVSCEDSAAERRRQIDFWLHFIATRMIPVEPIGKSLRFCMQIYLTDAYSGKLWRENGKRCLMFLCVLQIFFTVNYIKI